MPCYHVITNGNLLCQLPQKVNWEAERKFPSGVDKGELKSFYKLKSVFCFFGGLKKSLVSHLMITLLNDHVSGPTIVVIWSRSIYILSNNRQNSIGKYRSLMINLIYEGWFLERIILIAF